MCAWGATRCAHFGCEVRVGGYEVRVESRVSVDRPTDADRYLHAAMSDGLFRHGEATDHHADRGATQSARDAGLVGRGPCPRHSEPCRHGEPIRCYSGRTVAGANVGQRIRAGGFASCRLGTGKGFGRREARCRGIRCGACRPPFGNVEQLLRSRRPEDLALISDLPHEPEEGLAGCGLQLLR